MSTIHLAYATAESDRAFMRRMDDLRQLLITLPGVGLSHDDDPNWTNDADILVAVMDVPLPILPGVICARSAAGKCTRIFYPAGSLIPNEMTQCVVEERERMLAQPEMFKRLWIRLEAEKVAFVYKALPDPISYFDDAEIVGCVESLLIRNAKRPQVVRDTD